MINLFKLIKTITNNDILALFVHKNDMNHLGVKIENSSRKASTTFKLNLMDLNNGNIRIPPAQFSSVIQMKSTDFQKICRDMVNISDEIEIKAVDNSLILTCKGEFAEQETVIGECSSNGISFCQHSNDSRDNSRYFFFEIFDPVYKMYKFVSIYTNIFEE